MKEQGESYAKKCFCTWKHGWYFYDEIIDPVLLINTNDYCFHHLVHNETQRKYLVDCGYKNVVSVGMPYIYIKPQNVFRIPNSILVMPHHSLLYSNTKTLSTGLFISYILELKNKFDHVAICLHSACYEKYSEVTNILCKLNVECLCGADSGDMHSLLRMNIIFSSFEYVTTSSIGSHVVYAAFSGCKVSVSENMYYEYGYDDFKNDPFYLTNPQILDFVIENVKLKTIIKKYSFLFTDPEHSKEYKLWANTQLGYEYKLANDHVIKYLQSSTSNQILASVYSLKSTVTGKKALRNRLYLLLWKIKNLKMLLKNKIKRKK